jgi:hypothetical protein
MEESGLVAGVEGCVGGGGADEAECPAWVPDDFDFGTAH